MEAMTADNVKTWTDVATPLIGAYGASSSKKFESRQINRNANAIAAKGSRDAQEVRRQGKLMASNARAAMAGSGGMVGDAGGIEGLAAIKQVSDQNALSVLFESDTQSENLRMKSRAVKQSARGDIATGVRKSLGTVLRDADKIFKVK